MKKILFSLSIILSLGISVFYAINYATATVSDEFADEVFPWMVEHSLTKFTDIDDFRPAGSITRGEASKFVVNYAGLIDLEKWENSCNFRDTKWFDASLNPYIIDACGYWLFRGNNGNFLPRNSITEAEALVVIVRSLEGMMDENQSPWYGAYYDRAYELSIIQDEDDIDMMGTTRITREKLGTWLHRAYRSDALEDTIVYETEVEWPSDCSSYEKYDERKKVCSYECIDEAECKTIQSQIDSELAGWTDSLEWSGRDAPTWAWESSSANSKVLYSVTPGEKITKKSGTDTSEYRDLWKEVADLSPDTLSDTYIEEFEIYEDASSDVIAYVSDDDENGKWKMSINLPTHKLSDNKEQKTTLIHELSHIITLNKNEFITPNGTCPNYETDEGCTKSTAYLNNFVKRFWWTAKTATYDENKFVTEYATTSPEEDIAESFAFFVLGTDFSDTNIRNQKLNFFNSYPALVKIRTDMRNILASDIVRARKMR